MSTPQATLSEIFSSYQGEGARVGEKQLFVRFAGCNLRCQYCDTPESLVRVPRCEVSYPSGGEETISNPIGVAALAAIVARFLAEDPGIARIALTGGEPMVQHRFITAWLRQEPPARGCLLETAATLSSGLEDLLPHLDTVSADIKLPSNSGEAPLWDRHREFFIKCSVASRIYVKMPVCDATDDDEVRVGARLARELLPGALLYLQPITDPDGGAWRLGTSRMLALVAAAAAEAPRAVLLPQMHKMMAIR
jgi:7-carboxy-7-deazaguanine synthase